MSKCFNKECDYCKDNECRFGIEDNAGCHWYIGEPLKEPLSKKFQDYAEEELPKLREQIEQKDQRIAELKKEVEGLNTKLKIWNRFNSEDYMHKGENVTDRDYYYYTNGASSVLENDLKYYKQENEQLKQQLSEKDKLLEKENKALEIACKKIEDLRFENADICDYEYNEIKTEIRIKLLLEEAEEALEKLNKE